MRQTLDVISQFRPPGAELLPAERARLPAVRTIIDIIHCTKYNIKQYTIYIFTYIYMYTLYTYTISLSVCLSLSLSISLSLYIYIYIYIYIYGAEGCERRVVSRAGLASIASIWKTADTQDSSKGGAVETGCSDLHYIIGCFII